MESLSDTNNKKRTIHVDDIGVRKLTMDMVSNCHKQPAIAINIFFKISGYYRIFQTKKNTVGTVISVRMWNCLWSAIARNGQE